MKPSTDFNDEELALGAALALAMERHPIPRETPDLERMRRGGDRMAKAQPAPGPARPGLQLVPSKRNPRVKRWQRTAEEPQGARQAPRPTRAVVDSASGLVRALRRRPDGQGGHVSLQAKQLEIVLNRGTFGLISAGKSPQDDHALTDEELAERDARLRKALDEAGYVYTKAQGHYGEREDSYLVMVHDADREHLTHLGRELNQDSVIYGEAGQYELIFTTGENAERGLCVHGDSWSRVGEEQADFYTEVEGAGRFTLDLDFDKIGPCKGGGMARMKKAVVKAHTRRTRSGKVVQVREHQDSRGSGGGAVGSISFPDAPKPKPKQPARRGVDPQSKPPPGHVRSITQDAYGRPVHRDLPDPARQKRPAAPKGGEPEVPMHNMHLRERNKGRRVFDSADSAAAGHKHHAVGKRVHSASNPDDLHDYARKHGGDSHHAIIKDGDSYHLHRMDRKYIPGRMRKGTTGRAVVRAAPKGPGPSEPAQRAGEGEYGTPHEVQTGQHVRYRLPDDESGTTKVGKVHRKGKNGVTVICPDTGRACRVPHGWYVSALD